MRYNRTDYVPVHHAVPAPLRVLNTQYESLHHKKLKLSVDGAGGDSKSNRDVTGSSRSFNQHAK